MIQKFSFPKSNRILKRKDFLRLSKKGQKIHNKLFILVYCCNKDERKNSSRLGVTVSKKVGRACKRNRIKRLIREYFRVNKYAIKKACDINIIAKKEVANQSSDQVVYYLKDNFEKLSNRLSNK